jgi:hypothetical protein
MKHSTTNVPPGVVIDVALLPGHWFTTVADGLAEEDEVVETKELDEEDAEIDMEVGVRVEMEELGDGL